VSDPGEVDDAPQHASGSEFVLDPNRQHQCQYTGRKKFKRQHDKILEMAIMKACSDQYEDFNDNNLANFVKTYITGINMNV